MEKPASAPIPKPEQPKLEELELSPEAQKTLRTVAEFLCHGKSIHLIIKDPRVATSLIHGRSQVLKRMIEEKIQLLGSSKLRASTVELDVYDLTAPDAKAAQILDRARSAYSDKHGAIDGFSSHYPGKVIIINGIENIPSYANASVLSPLTKQAPTLLIQCGEVEWEDLHADVQRALGEYVQSTFEI